MVIINKTEIYDKLFESVLNGIDTDAIKNILSNCKGVVLHSSTSLYEQKKGSSLPAWVIVHSGTDEEALNVLKILHDKDEEIDKWGNKAGIKNGQYFMPLFYLALERNYFNTSAFLSDVAKISIDQIGSSKHTTLFFLAEEVVQDASKKEEHKKRIKFLLEKGANISNIFDKDDKIRKKAFKMKEIIEECVEELKKKGRKEKENKNLIKSNKTQFFSQALKLDLLPSTDKKNSEKKQRVFYKISQANKAKGFFASIINGISDLLSQKNDSFPAEEEKKKLL